MNSVFFFYVFNLRVRVGAREMGRSESWDVFLLSYDTPLGVGQ